MPDIQLRDVIDGLRSRLQAELESELAAVATTHEQAIEDARRAAAEEARRAAADEAEEARRAAAAAAEDARREAEAEAERQWSARLDAVRADWSTRLHDELAAARTDAERQMVAETMRVRVDAEQTAAEASAALRRELEDALAAERERAAEELRIERDRADRALTEARAALEAERDKSAAALAEAGTTPAVSIESARLLTALAAIDEAESLTGVLRAAVRAASSEARRATMLIVNGAQLDEWVVPDAQSLGAGAIRVDGREAGFLSHVLQRGEPIVPGRDMAAPLFASLPAGRRSIGAPLVLGGETVAVLYADEGSTGEATPGWPEAVQVIARHAAASLARITALRTYQALGTSGPQAPAGFAAAPSAQDEEEGARRYARLLVSEIKLYNEAAVKAGRQMRDLSHRLRPEIERARRLYDERIAASVASRDLFFQEELVQTLAGGDSSLLG